MCGLESETSLFGGLLEGNTELKELEDNVLEIVEEEIVVISVFLNPRLHLLVLGNCTVFESATVCFFRKIRYLHISWQHHQCLGLGILILLGTIPLAPVPLLLNE
jgi:hypothetical protein